MRVRPLLAAVSLTLSLTACGAGAGTASGTGAGNDGVAGVGGGSATPAASASGSAPTDRREAQLKFAQCMREHGMDVPDPGPDGRVMIRQGKGGGEATAQKAMQECEHFMKDVVSDKGPANDPKARDQMLKYAQCMRQHGVDMPDPGTDGRFRVEIPKGGEPKLKEAEEACKEFAPNLKGPQ
ncbi:hypothetical protein [Streptosporangium carneum]|uniref:Secreted protein n=1 Tax=Streptosporangium carneum TaxID=47481 RepID=A0A9W6HVK5_9ACTN|nr:hypothetical protein [Streptosporangium carneum]GLK07097.1 hypothetical protein GCM10017600_05020 [Streptosporangium carneum]